MSATTHIAAGPAPAPKTAGGWAPARSVTPAASRRLQRACSCGGGCDSCRKKKAPTDLLQRKAVAGAPARVAAPKPVAPKPTTPQPVAAKPSVVPLAVPGKDGKAAAAKPTGAAQNTQAAAPKPVAVPPKPASAAPKGAAPAKENAASGETPRVPEVVNRVLAMPGQPLDPAVRFQMEGRFGHSFGDVRVHDDSLAAESARAVYAHAYTVGQHIVFDAGQYRPSTPEGAQLLAHELTHTIQQHGLQRSSSGVGMETTGEYHHLEREAESVSRTVMQRAGPVGVPTSPSRSNSPVLSRTAKSKTPIADGDAKKKPEWVAVDPSTELGGAGVAEILRSDANPDLIAVRMSKPFEIPKEKGPAALKLWEAQANAKALQAIMAPGSNEPSTTTGLKQDRPDTDKLRDLWLLKLHWKKGSADGLWKASAKKAFGTDAGASFDPTRADVATKCDLDHIVELQFGGNNVPNNIQTLDSSPNRSSGSQIGQFLKKTAVEVRNALDADSVAAGKPKPSAAAIRLEFSSVTVAPGATDYKCVKVEDAATKIELTEEQKGGSKGKPFPMKSGGFDVCVFIENDSEADIKLAESDVAENKAASTLVPGLVLQDWKRPTKQDGQPQCGADDAAAKPETPAATGEPKKQTKGAKAAAAAAAAKAGGMVNAALDPTSRILGPPLKMDEKAKIELERSSSGVLSAPNKDPKVAFAIDYLSKGMFHKLQIEADGSLSGAGSIEPSVAFLPKPFQVEFDKNRFVMSTAVTKPRLPFKGIAEITEAKVGLQIAPEFKPYGKVAFRVAPGGRQVLHGELTVSADASGLVVEGDVFATIPGVDEAKGHLEMRNKKWSGGVEIKSSDFGGKSKYVKNGEVSITFTEERGIEGKGSVDLEVPGVRDPVKAQVFYNNDEGWAFHGKARFHPPKIEPVDIDLWYRKGHLTGTGETGIEYSHIGGRIMVQYEDEKFSGTGTLSIKTERATGELKLVMTPREHGHPKFTGEGHVSYQVTPDLIATAGIKIDDNEKVQVVGELEFPKPIELFKGFHGNYEIFHVSVPIPIPGANIGGIGLEAVITGALSAGYGAGPVQLLNTKAKAQFEPLESNPEVEMWMWSRLHIVAGGNVTGSITGDVKIDAFVASVSGGLTLSAGAELDAVMDLPTKAHYKDGKIDADVDFRAMIALLFKFGLSAHVHAEAGVGWLSVGTGKTWCLGTYTYDTGLKLGMKLKKPIHYATDEDLQLPSADDIEWIKPDIHIEDALKKVFAAGEKPEHDE